jgi:hypothetical protein
MAKAITIIVEPAIINGFLPLQSASENPIKEKSKLATPIPTLKKKKKISKLFVSIFKMIINWIKFFIECN